jgi:phosphomannomutase
LRSRAADLKAICEMSGHMFFADRYQGYDDALYAACRPIEIVSKSGKPLSAQLAGLSQMVSTPEIRIDCPDEMKFAVVERVADRFRRWHQVVDIDGVRVLFPQGWGLVRAGGALRGRERGVAGPAQGRGGGRGGGGEAGGGGGATPRQGR